MKSRVRCSPCRGDLLTLVDDDQNQFCVTLSSDMTIFEVRENSQMTESTEISFADFVSNLDAGGYDAGDGNAPEFEANGEMVGDCLVADSLIIEFDED